MITLYQFPDAWGLPNVGPFCMKVETYLRMKGLAFRTAVGDPRKAPKGKLPYIEEGDLRLGDSGFIVEHLERKHPPSLDAGIDPLLLATGHAMRRLMEESLYFGMLHERWVDEQGFDKARAIFHPLMPGPLKTVVPALIRRKVIESLRAQGIGRHSATEIAALGRADLDALSVFLGDKAFFLGDRPTTLDATAHAFLANVLGQPFASALRRHAQGLSNVGEYCERMKARFFET